MKSSASPGIELVPRRAARSRDRFGRLRRGLAAVAADTVIVVDVLMPLQLLLDRRVRREHGVVLVLPHGRLALAAPSRRGP